MALTAISLALLGSQNEQQRLQTMLTVLTQTSLFVPVSGMKARRVQL
jgi:hypothetical protein